MDRAAQHPIEIGIQLFQESRALHRIDDGISDDRFDVLEALRVTRDRLLASESPSPRDLQYFGTLSLGLASLEQCSNELRFANDRIESMLRTILIGRLVRVARRPMTQPDAITEYRYVDGYFQHPGYVLNSSKPHPSTAKGRISDLSANRGVLRVRPTLRTPLTWLRQSMFEVKVLDADAEPAVCVSFEESGAGGRRRIR
jgi:hypothetical protein